MNAGDDRRKSSSPQTHRGHLSRIGGVRRRLRGAEGHSVGGAGSIELHGQFQPYIGNFFKDRGAGRRSMRGDLPCLTGGSERGCDNRALPRGLLTPRGP